LLGAPIDWHLADRVDASHLSPLSPIDDVRGSAFYRCDAVVTLLRRLLGDLSS
jgi:CO/xanthine dehydrogenase FAD-binding subunit